MNDVSISQTAALCFQCSKCTAGCPAAPDMTIAPHRVMHLLALGQEDRVQRENTIWMCAACYTCATRCPNDIDIPGLFDELRAHSATRPNECPVPEVLKFHNRFLRDLKRRGRLHELRMMLEYNLAIRLPFRNASVAVRMFLRRRLPLRPPPHIKGFRKWVARQSGRAQ